MQCRELAETERERVNAFYQLTTYKRPVSPNDRVFVVESSNEILGALRIELLNDVQTLRGMYLHPEHLRTGIGTRLLRHVEPTLNNRLSFCIPFQHLREFYSQVNFQQVTEFSEAPEFLWERVKAYQLEGKDIILMRRECNLKIT